MQASTGRASSKTALCPNESLRKRRKGVRLMNLDEGDMLVAIKRVPIIAGTKIEGAAESETAEEEETEAGMERSVMTETEPQS